MFGKIIIIGACLAMLTLQAYSQVQAASCSTSSAQAMQTAADNTISNCQSGLNGVKGPGSGSAALLSIVIKLSIGSLLDNLVAALSPLLATVGALVIALLNLVLKIVVAVVNLVIKLLSGLLGVSAYQSKLKNLNQSSCNEVNSYSNTGLSGVLGLVLNLVGNLLELVIGIKL